MVYEKEFIREKLETNDVWLYRGILAIYDRQTQDEKRINDTVDRNGVGFNAFDADIMSSFAKVLMEKRDLGYPLSLSVKQKSIARRVMKKYAGQLARIANNEI